MCVLVCLFYVAVLSDQHYNIVKYIPVAIQNTDLFKTNLKTLLSNTITTNQNTKVRCYFELVFLEILFV